MSKLTRQLVLIASAQIACVAVGVGMQHRFVHLTVRHAVEEHAWRHLEQRAAHLARAVERNRPDKLNVAPSTPGDPRDWATTLDPSEGSVLLLDNAWRLVTQQSGPETPANVALSPGDAVRWTPLADADRSTAPGQRGTLELPDGPVPALARSLRYGLGVVVMPLPVEAIARDTAALLHALPGISVMAVIWTGALLGLAAYMILSRYHERLESERSAANTKTLQHMQDLVRARDTIIFGLAKLADSRDADTGDHLDRISIYSTTLTVALRRHPKFKDRVPPNLERIIGISSALHDIGKVGIEDRILLKPGPLTPEERTRMQTHAKIGGECLRQIERRLGSSNFLQAAREIAIAHHERWDGGGYPEGLSGERIPLAARIVAIADVYDALSSRRVYKEPLEHEQCVEIIRQQAGRHFDPDLVEVWLTLADKFREIARRYARPTSPPAPDEPVHAASTDPSASDETLPRAVALSSDGFR